MRPGDHPKGVGWGWGQGSVQAGHFLPKLKNKLNWRDNILIGHALCTDWQSCWTRKGPFPICCQKGGSTLLSWIKIRGCRLIRHEKKKRQSSVLVGLYHKFAVFKLLKCFQFVDIVPCDGDKGSLFSKGVGFVSPISNRVWGFSIRIFWESNT